MAEQITPCLWFDNQAEIDYYWDRRRGRPMRLAERQIRTFLADHSCHSSDVDSRSVKGRESNQSISANEQDGY